MLLGLKNLTVYQKSYTKRIYRFKTRQNASKKSKYDI